MLSNSSEPLRSITPKWLRVRAAARFPVRCYVFARFSHVQKSLGIATSHEELYVVAFRAEYRLVASLHRCLKDKFIVHLNGPGSENMLAVFFPSEHVGNRFIEHPPLARSSR